MFQSRPMPFQQRTNTSCYLAIPTHGFTVVLSVFWGTPPAKPLNCKSVSNRSGALIGHPWAEPIGEESFILGTRLNFLWSDIIETSFYYRSQSVHLLLLPITFSFRGIKNPAYTGKRGGEIVVRFFTCLHRDYPKYLQDMSLRA